MNWGEAILDEVARHHDGRAGGGLPGQGPQQAFLVTETGSTRGRAEAVPGLAALAGTAGSVLASVSCPSGTACTAVGNYWNKADTIIDMFTVKKPAS